MLGISHRLIQDALIEERSFIRFKIKVYINISSIHCFRVNASDSDRSESLEFPQLGIPKM